MSLLSVRCLARGLRAQPWRPAGLFGARGFAEPGTGERLSQDPRTQASKERDSIRHAAEGDVSEATKDVGEMAKQAAKGAKESAKLMYDSVKEKVTGEPSSARESLKKGSS
eukprot:scaffold13.g242.t1